MCILSQKYGKQFILSHENIFFFFPALNYITYSDFLRVSSAKVPPLSGDRNPTKGEEGLQRKD